MSKDCTRFYHSGAYTYMEHPSFQIKWGVVRHLALRHSLPPRRMLDLACGKTTLVDFMSPSDYERYVGIDSCKEVVRFLRGKNTRGTSWIYGDIEHMTLPRLNGNFNVLLWCGIQNYVEAYQSVLAKFKALLSDDAIVILDYMVYPPSKWEKRVGGVKLYHVDGCRLELPYVPKEAKGWSKVNMRIIECLRTEK